MLRQMERDVGLDKLSRVERDVFLAAHNLSEKPGDIVHTEQIRKHTLVETITQATYHRALRTLLSMGMLEHAENTKARCYIVRRDLIGR